MHAGILGKISPKPLPSDVSLFIHNVGASIEGSKQSLIQKIELIASNVMKLSFHKI